MPTQELLDFMAQQISILDQSTLNTEQKAIARRNYEEIQKRLKAETVANNESEQLFGLDPLFLEDLPEEIRKELNVTDTQKFEAQALELLKIAQRPLSLNELMVGFYRKYGLQYKRVSLTSRLYRMANNRLLNNQKGIYSLPNFSTQTPVTKEEIE